MDSESKVYFTKDITPENLLKLYHVLGQKVEGKVAIKIHSGEHDKPHIVQPEFMKPLVDEVKGTFIEANIAVAESKRHKTEDHLKVIEKHGFTKVAPTEIIDAEGEIELPIKNGKALTSNFIGKGLEKYDWIIVISHFKGHGSAGFGGALKNVAIGIASAHGKCVIHGGNTLPEIVKADKIRFQKAMADADKAVIDFKKGKLLYINVMKDLSIDCDCVKDPRTPELSNIGMLSSTDPVALDKACLDLIYNSPEKGKESLINRIEEKKGHILLDTAEELGIGKKKYQLITIDK